MNVTVIRFAFRFVAITVFAAIASAAFAEGTLIAVGTGQTAADKKGGEVICKLLNDTRATHGIRCITETSEVLVPGSIFNARALQLGELDFGFANFYWIYRAFRGEDQFREDGPGTDLRTVFSLDDFPAILVAQKDLDIREMSDLTGLEFSISITNGIGSGLVPDVAKSLGWTPKIVDQRGVLFGNVVSICEKKSDVEILFVLGSVKRIEDIVTKCNLSVIDVDANSLEKLTSAWPYLRKMETTVFGRPYATFGVIDIFAASADTPDEIVYQLVKTVFQNLDRFKAAHAQFSGLTVKAMTRQTREPPLHPGAIRYYKEIGRIK